MSIIDLDANQSTAPGEFSGNITLKRGGKEEPHVYATIETAWQVDADNASVLDAVLPGASLLFGAADVAVEAAERAEALDGAAAGAAAGSKGTFGEYKVRVPHADYTITLGSPDADGAVAFDAEIRAVRLKATPKAKVFRVKFDTGPLDAEDVGVIADLMCCDVIEITTARKGQQVLAFTRPEQDVAEVGRIVSGVYDGVEFAGKVVGHAEDDDSGKMVEVDNFGTVFMVPIGTVAGSIKVIGAHGDSFDESVTAYIGKAEEVGVDFGWEYLIPALGRAYLANGKAGDEWPLTDGVIGDAIRAARQRATA